MLFKEQIWRSWCFFSRNNKRWKVLINSFNWLIHEQLEDLKACTLQMGDYTKVNRLVLRCHGWPLISSSSQKLDGIAVGQFGKDSKGPDVNQYIRRSAIYFFESTLYFVWRQYGRTFVWRNDVGVGSLVFFTANWSGPRAVWWLDPLTLARSGSLFHFSAFQYFL